MGLETATHINDLNSSNPLGSATKAQGDDHIRLVKDVLKRDLPMTQAAGAKGLELLYTATNAAAKEALGLSYTGHRNRVINAGFLVNQRYNFASQAITAGAPLQYITDRFFVYCITNNTTANANSFGEFIVNAPTLPATITVGTRLPAFAIRGMGNATLSVKISANTVTTVNWFVYNASTTDTFGTVAAPTKSLRASGSFNVTTTTNVFSANFNASSITGLEILFTSAATTVTYSEVQLEQGTIANSDIVFDYHDPITTLARCNYFYQEVTTNVRAPSTTNGQIFSNSVNWAQMRIAPTAALKTAGTTNLSSGQVLAAPTTTGARFEHTSTGAGDCYSIANIYSLDSEMYT